MFASRVSRLLISSLLAGAFLAGCKGHDSTVSIAQSLQNWVWESGTNLANSEGYYPTPIGTVSAISQPSGRYGAMTWWNQSTHEFWVFSGTGGVSDVWKFSNSNQEWTWMAGNASTSPISSGIYPAAPGETAATFFPGQRANGSTWIDTSGNLWMFGGNGIDSTGQSGFLNDMWSYSPTTNWWTWQGPLNSQYGGTSAHSAQASYGTLGVAATSNLPGPRSSAANWTLNGVFYMFGGEANPSTQVGEQNDLWKFDPSTRMWTWLGGSQQINASGSYQNQGQASAYSQPGARQDSTTWVDSSGNLWMFGGSGIDSQANFGYLNDLWKYNPTTKNWTWMAGSPLINAIGSYGTNAVASSTTYPGARYGSIGWTDSSNNLWLFGGNGINSTGSVVLLDDLWEYQASSGQWVWLNGSYNGNASGYYGTLGLLAIQNIPGSRYGSSGFTDTSTGIFWLFAGYGIDAAGTTGRLSDVWKFTP